MKKFLLVALLLLTACSSESEKQYYQLPAGEGVIAPVNTDRAMAQRQLWLSHITVSDYLAGTGLVYQTSDVRYVMASSNLWASPLEQQLQQTMTATLSKALPGWLVSSQQTHTGQDKLEMAVTGFHGRYDGQVIIQGEWLLTHDERVVKRPFLLTLKQNEDGYDPLVRSLAQGWQQVGLNIAKEVTLLE